MKAVPMKAATTRRPLRPAWASALRMKCTRQRCHAACRTLLTALLMPSCASEMTSLTPRRPRRASVRKNAVQNVSASDGPISMPRTSRRLSLLTPTAMITPPRRCVRSRAPSHRSRQSTDTASLDRAAQEGFDPLVDLRAQPAHLALGDAAHPHRLDQVIGAGRHAVHIGLLHDRRQRFLGQPARLQKTREIAAFAQFGAAPPSRHVSPTSGRGSRCAERCPRETLDLQLHEALGGEADHLAQEIGVSALFQKRAKVHHLVGHRWLLESGWLSQPDPTRRIIDDRPRSRSLATALWEARFARVFATPSYTTTRDLTPLSGSQMISGSPGKMSVGDESDPLTFALLRVLWAVKTIVSVFFYV